MLSAVILNYRNPELTSRCVSRLLQASQESNTATEVIVVDNSAPQTGEILHRLLPPEVIIIENEKNQGFSKANNQAIKRAKGEYILIMNNDLFINAGVLEQGVAYLKQHTNTGIWAPKLTGEDGEAQRSCADFPTLTALIAEYLMKIPYHTRVAKSALKASKPVKVDSVIGACMFIPKSVLRGVGGFDEDYFFNVEDIDLCLKIKKNGFEIVFDPRFSAIHLVGASQDSEWYNDPYLHTSRMLYFRKNHHSLKSGMAALIIRTGIALRKMKHKLFIL